MPVLLVPVLEEDLIHMLTDEDLKRINVFIYEQYKGLSLLNKNRCDYF